jgi:hypothetical protein
LPRKLNRITEISSAGTDVHRVSLMCCNRSEPADAVARFTVSDSGDALSPK